MTSFARLSFAAAVALVPVAIACSASDDATPAANATPDASATGDAALFPVTSTTNGDASTTADGGDAGRAALAPFPADGALLGAFVNQATSSPEEIARELGRPLAFEMSYVSWSDDLATAKQGFLAAAIARHAIPELSWQLDGTDDCSGVTFDDITSGKQDTTIRAAAHALASFAPAWILLRPWWEMNGAWYCTNVKHQSTPGTCDGTAKYVAAWRHVHDLFAAEGVTNVRWVWSPSHQDPGKPECNHWSLYYPGDAYVDVVGVDGYNKFRQGDGGGPDDNLPWTDFRPLFQPIYDEYATKPFLVAETASAEDPLTPGRKAQWIRDALATMKTMPRVVGFTWFVKGRVKGDPDDYSLCTSQSAFDAFAAMANDPYFGGTGTASTFRCP